MLLSTKSRNVVISVITFFLTKSGDNTYETTCALIDCEYIYKTPSKRVHVFRFRHGLVQRGRFVCLYFSKIQV